MPTSLKKIAETNTTVFLHRCETCGKDAPFGYEASYRSALNAMGKGKVELAKKLLGVWFCYEHKKDYEKTKVLAEPDKGMPPYCDIATMQGVKILQFPTRQKEHGGKI